MYSHLSLVRALEIAEICIKAECGKSVQIQKLYDKDSADFIIRFFGFPEYSTPAERAVDSAWERNRVL